MAKKIMVVGTSAHNKGAELMHVAIQQELRREGSYRVVVPRTFGSVADRIRFDALSHVEPDRFKRDRLIRAVVPERVRQSLGLVWDDDIDSVIDASGFAFSDQLGVRRIQSAAKEFRRWKRQGKKIVLLPQALGPFRDPQVCEAMKSICESADLIYAREPRSREFVEAVSPGASNLRTAPDFTCLVRPSGFLSIDSPQGGVCVVPNKRMLSDTDESTSGAYLRFLRQCVQACERDGQDVWFLVHDRGDHQLAEELVREIARPIRVCYYEDSRVLKAAIGRADLVIGSRFHALVSALSQGVVALATSWSFKYEQLMSEYRLEGHMLHPAEAIEEALGRLRHVLHQRERISTGLRARAKEICEQSQKMWGEVWDLLK